MKRRKFRLTENNDGWHDYYDVMSEITIYDVLSEYYHGNSKRIDFELIDPNMYKKALSEFTRFGKLIHFPERYVYQWMGMMMRNTVKLRVCTELAGHDVQFPTSEICDFFYNNEDILEKYKDTCDIDLDYIDQYGYEEWSSFLDKSGFYDWMMLPDDTSAFSDYGIEPLEKLIITYNKDLPTEKVLVIINKMLDVTHYRGDLSSMFIVGGRNTLSQISEETHRRKKIIIKESQMIILKEYIG